MKKKKKRCLEGEIGWYIINTATEEHFSSGKRYSSIAAHEGNGTKIPSNSFQTVEKNCWR